MSESKQRASNGAIMNNRKSYACLDIGSMGVDLKENFEWVKSDFRLTRRLIKWFAR